MRRMLAALLICVATQAGAQALVHFDSLDPARTPLDGHLFGVPGAGPHPALVFLHGCSGLFAKSRKIYSREQDWARRFNAMGIVVLMVDSFGPRHQGEMCSPAHFDANVYRVRPFDAYAALRFLQARDDIRADRIGVIGWSQGGGTLLNTVRAFSPARPARLPQGDFRAAVAFYPASCSTARQGREWASPVALLVLVGAEDVWNPLYPCEELFGSVAPNTEASLHAYPGAYHDFDWPDMPVHEVPAFTTRAGVVPIEGTNPAARADAIERVTAFVTDHLLAR
jgi:dienelactone hydrolase